MHRTGSTMIIISKTTNLKSGIQLDAWRDALVSEPIHKDPAFAHGWYKIATNATVLFVPCFSFLSVCVQIRMVHLQSGIHFDARHDALVSEHIHKGLAVSTGLV